MRFFLGIVFHALCLARLTLGDKKSSNLTNGAPEDPARKLQKLKAKKPMAPKKSKSPKVPVGKKTMAPKKSASPKVPAAPKKSKSPKVPAAPKKSKSPKVPAAPKKSKPKVPVGKKPKAP